MSPNLELILSLFAELEENHFYGTVEVTLQDGKLSYVRKLQSEQDFEIAARNWERLPDSAKLKLQEKFTGHAKFNKLITDASKLKSSRKP